MRNIILCDYVIINIPFGKGEVKAMIKKINDKEMAGQVGDG